jgi:hypothetical protein
MWGKGLWRAVAIIGVLLLALGGIETSTGTETRQQAAPVLRLHRGTINAAAPATLANVRPLSNAEQGMAIIQFAGPIQPTDQGALARTGVAIIEYLPDFAYLVRGTEGQLQAAAAVPGVYARAPFVLADKLAPPLLDALVLDDLSRPVAVRMLPWEGKAAALSAALGQVGLDPSVPLTSEQVLAAAALPEVRWVEPAFVPRLLNDSARTIMRVGAAWERHGLYGAGQIVGVADSGIDTGDLATISPDFAGRILATHVLAPGGTLADELGHGTHVAGSLAGAGVRSGANPVQREYEGSFAGVAPEASLVIQAFEVTEGGAVTGLGDDPFAILQQAYASGARIHSNSWGGPTGIPFLDVEGYFGGYTTPSRRTDEFIWQNPDMAVFFAAGNSGNDGDYYLAGCLPNGDGWIDDDSLVAPGTAKNVITVGASEGVFLEGRLATFTWAEFDPSCYSREPLASDRISDNANGMAAFSSRGPVNDGRMKPDIVAPGTSIVSNRSSHPDALPLWGVHPSNSNYVLSGGTSMSTPLAAGAGALVREWLGRQGSPNPSAAAIKAVLVSTAADIAPGQYVVGGRQEIPAQRPNIVAGWGRVDLGFLGAAEPYRLWLDDRSASIATGAVVTYEHSAVKPLNVISSDQPLRVTLVWTDPPASLSAARQLVNDLDLVVTGPDGRAYWGNNVIGGDRVNNVEGVILQSPPQGTYRIEVRAYNIPVSTQPFALVVAGPLAASPLALEVNSGLALAEGGSATIDRTALRATGPLASQIIYTLQTVPAYGVLQTGENPIAVGATFTQADVDAGRLIYRHDGGETQRDGFSVVIAGGTDRTIEAEFSVTITPVNDPPVTVPDLARALPGEQIVIDVLANDSDAEGDSLTIASVGAATAGFAATDGSRIRFTAPQGWAGSASFTYVVRDSGGATAEGLVVIDVVRPGEAPSKHQVFLPTIRR